MPTWLRYALLQIPDLILLSIGLMAAVRWWGLSETAAYTIFALWVAKDIALYPMMRVGYATGASQADRLAGATGVAREDLDPTGYVTVASELWVARVSRDAAPVPTGSRVRVVGVDGLTLLVEPLVGDAA